MKLVGPFFGRPEKKNRYIQFWLCLVQRKVCILVEIGDDVTKKLYVYNMLM